MSIYKEILHKKRTLNFFREIRKWGSDSISFLIYRMKWNLVAKHDYVTKFPLHLDIETTESCNLKCIMCVHGIDGVPNTGMIDVGFAKSLIDQASDGGTKSIKFNWRGEPALHKGLEELVAYAKHKGILEVQINTNGIPFTEKRIRTLIESGIDRVIFSMDGASKETYEKIRVGAKYENLIRNIRIFRKIRDELNLSKPLFRIQMVRMSTNDHELDSFIEMWKDIVDDISIKDVTDRGQGGELYVGDKVAIGRRRCNQPWQRMIVSREGNVYPCCSDWHESYPIGNAHKNKLSEIWMGSQMERLREINRKKELNSYDPCKNCIVLSSYDWKKR